MSGYPNLATALAGQDLADVAKRSGVSVAGIEALLSGDYVAPQETRQRLADALGWRTVPGVGQRHPADLFWRGDAIESALAGLPDLDPLPESVRRALDVIGDFPARVYPVAEPEPNGG